MLQNSSEIFYLHACSDSATLIGHLTVFFHTSTKASAELLCGILGKELSPTYNISFQSSRTLPAEDLVLYEESIANLSIYDDPDPGVYDPRPEPMTLVRAQLARRSFDLEQIIMRLNSGTGPAPAVSYGTQANLFGTEDERAAALMLLMLFAQAYYHLLQSTVSTASWLTMLDMQLNESYLWVTQNLQNLLKNATSLADFPSKFEPALPDLYPSTIRDLDWDLLSPDADAFLSEVQRYVQKKGFIEPPQGTSGRYLVEVFRRGIDTSIERGNAYDKRVRNHLKSLKLATPADSSEQDGSPAVDQSPKPVSDEQLGHVFISYCHDDAKFLLQLRQHLKPLERAGRVTAWSDSQIQPGSRWFEEIQAALLKSKVAVLLITPAFLASDFIHEHELGPLLKNAENGGVTILWVLVRDCNWSRTPIARLQAAHPTKKALANMRAERDAAWVAICARIEAVAASTASNNSE